MSFDHPAYTEQQNWLINWLLNRETSNKYLISLRNQINLWLAEDEPLFPVPLSEKQLESLRRTYETVYKPREKAEQPEENSLYVAVYRPEQARTNSTFVLLGGPLHQKTISLPKGAQAVTILASSKRVTYVADKIGSSEVFIHQPLSTESLDSETIME